jgi:sulfur carrier protein
MTTLKINGEDKAVENVGFLSDLLTKLQFNAQYLAVAVNERVVPRSEHGVTRVKDGDRIEVIHAVGGG